MLVRGLYIHRLSIGLALYLPLYHPVLNRFTHAVSHTETLSVPTFVPIWIYVFAGQRLTGQNFLIMWTAQLDRKTLPRVRFMRAVGTAAGEPLASHAEDHETGTGQTFTHSGLGTRERRITEIGANPSHAWP